MFKENTNLDWPSVELTALKFVPMLQAKVPDYYKEMHGVVDGSGINLASIIALNVRTEITYGLMKDDGCTMLAWKTSSTSFLAQNWDWRVEQKENLVVLSILKGGDYPRIKMVTEAGIIGKIGLNSEGVGVCLNAISAKGMNTERLPVHLGLRLCLESRSAEEAVKKLKDVGIAAACTITVADGMGAVALECSSIGMHEITMDTRGRVFHSNHYLKKHEGVVDKVLPQDTIDRVARIEALADGVGEKVTLDKIAALFKDESGFPAAICRAKQGESKGATLFNIVSDLTAKRALVKLGRPTEPDETFWLDFTPN